MRETRALFWKLSTGDLSGLVSAFMDGNALKGKRNIFE